MSVMQIKRGTTEAWNRGPELINFEKLAINGKDSVINCCKNTITMTIGAPSMNAPCDGAGKTNGIAIVSLNELNSLIEDSAVCISAKIELADPETAEAVLTTDQDWGVACYGKNLAAGSWPLLSAGSLKATIDGANSGNIGTSNRLDRNIFVWWGADWCNKPTDVKITLSVRKVGAGTEGLVSGQLGAEYFANGGVGLKVGPHDSSTYADWAAIPYIGQVLPSCMYGSETDMNNISAPIPGQLFFVKVT